MPGVGDGVPKAQSNLDLGMEDRLQWLLTIEKCEISVTQQCLSFSK